MNCINCHSHSDVYYTINGAQFCENCAFEKFNIDLYVPPTFRCSQCDSKCQDIHFVNDNDNHFCSAECAIKFSLNNSK